MAVALVSGIFAIVLTMVSWLLTNGSKRTRLLHRIERQTAVLKDLPPDHPARAALDDSLVSDVVALGALGKPSSSRTAEAHSGSGNEPRTSMFVATVAGAIIAAVLSLVSAMVPYLRG